MGSNRTKWIHKPYPRVSHLRDQFLISLSFGLFIFLFLVFFQPFGLGDMTTNKSLYVFGFGLITTFVMLANYLISSRAAPKYFNPDKWTVGKDILYGLFNIIAIALFNYLYHVKVGGQAIDPGAILTFIIITASVGAFPLTIMVFVNELYLNDRHQKHARKLSQQLEDGLMTHPSTNEQRNMIIGDSENDSLELNLDDLIFIQASDNYCTVHYLEANKLSTQLIRTTLKSIETQLGDFPELKRCHRSFMVNRQKISKISGNARAYYIHFFVSDQTIPVSRGIKKDSFLS